MGLVKKFPLISRVVFFKLSNTDNNNKLLLTDNSLPKPVFAQIAFESR